MEETFTDEMADQLVKNLDEGVVDFKKADFESIEEFRVALAKVTKEIATKNTANPELEEKFERLRACIDSNNVVAVGIIERLSQSIIDSKNMDLHREREERLTSQQSQIQGQIAQNLQHVEEEKMS
ncbi:MAG: hypothetical protein LBH47_00255 [Christensenellaceae bacterium]|jgi:hypothetical protein|nr:hypothetical protein [Christensenellaceae bacterium]